MFLGAMKFVPNGKYVLLTHVDFSSFKNPANIKALELSDNPRFPKFINSFGAFFLAEYTNLD